MRLPTSILLAAFAFSVQAIAATPLWLLDVPLPAELDGKPVTSAFARSAGAE